MQIQILNVQTTTVPTAKSSYQQLDIAYKNLTFQGKVEGKKIVSFSQASTAAFKALAVAQPNEVYEITTNKNDEGFIDWLTATKSTRESKPAAPQASTYSGTANASPKSTYETPEERAKKQIYIVRQSSVSNAIELLSVNTKNQPKLEEVLDTAKRIEGFVFGDYIGGDSVPSNEEIYTDDIPM